MIKKIGRFVLALFLALLQAGCSPSAQSDAKSITEDVSEDVGKDFKELGNAESESAKDIDADDSSLIDTGNGVDFLDDADD
jgi:hypothetical protein